MVKNNHSTMHQGGSHTTHAPIGATELAYAEAYSAAQPDPGRRVVVVDLQCEETGWEFTRGITARA